MNILLIRPPRIKQSINLSEMMFSEPIGLEMLYKVLGDKHQVDVIDLMVETDLQIEEVLKAKDYEAVGITSLCIDVENVIDLSQRIKAYNKKISVFVGGTQAYFMPEAFFTPAIDYIFKFTTEDNLVRLMEAIERQEIEPIEGVYIKALDYTCKAINGRNSYITPDRSCTQKYRKHYSYFGYQPCAIMGTAQGCSKKCDFCLRWRLEGGCETYRSMEEIIAEIKEIEEDSIMIFDNDFLHNKGRLLAFCKALTHNHIHKNFIVYGSVRSIIDHEAEVALLGTLGLKAVLVGYESFQNTELEAYRKKSTIDENQVAASILKKHGIDCWASFIAHPDWDKEDFKKLRQYIYHLRPENTTMSPLTPFSPLPMYEQYKERLLYDKTDYLMWSFGNVVIKPSKLSLKAYYKEMFKTVVWVNIRTNRPLHMIKQYGIKNIIRLMRGALQLSKRYKKLT